MLHGAEHHTVLDDLQFESASDGGGCLGRSRMLDTSWKAGEWKSLRQESSNALEPTAGSKGAVCFTGMSLDRSFDGPVGTPNLDIPFVPSIYHVCQW